MRLLALPLVLLTLGLSLAAWAAPQPQGSLELEGANGLFVIRGHGGLLGHVDRGEVQVTDLSPGDSWRWWLNGKEVPRHATVSGTAESFRILGGDYRLVVSGEGVSISARGSGVAYLEGLPVPSGSVGRYSTDLSADCQVAPEVCSPIPATRTRVSFGVTAKTAGVSGRALR